jgi:hypothetical protein
VLLAQEVSLEYRVKAAYLFNFVKFVEWPQAARSGPLTICVAGRDVLGDVLDRTVEGETVNGRPIVARRILEPTPDCHVVFVPRGAAAQAYLRPAQGAPVLTVGETPDFIENGGIVNFVLEGTNVRFEMNPAAADRVGIRISSRLLRLARVPGEGR